MKASVYVSWDLFVLFMLDSFFLFFLKEVVQAESKPAIGGVRKEDAYELKSSGERERASERARRLPTHTTMFDVPCAC